MVKIGFVADRIILRDLVLAALDQRDLHPWAGRLETMRFSILDQSRNQTVSLFGDHRDVTVDVRSVVSSQRNSCADGGHAIEVLGEALRLVRDLVFPVGPPSAGTIAVEPRRGLCETLSR